MSGKFSYGTAKNGQTFFRFEGQSPIREPHLFYGFLVEDPVNAMLRRRAEHYNQELRLRGWLTPTDQMHISLIGLGDGKQKRVVEIARHVGLLMQATPFDVCFDRLSAFGGGALVLRSSDHSPTLQAFWRKLSAVIDDSPLKPFITTSLEPHVTLLRDRRGVPKVRERIVEPISWTVRSFSLIRSHQGEYKCPATWQLTGQDDSLAGM
ncbi:2'-5' RNA ligase family protein [Mesorhizobium sp. LMG17149]|uniref:2'-5' RNA ligase family protein n=1 Tax=Mesorhizobium sp. LMG17149 TaxID=2968497 RepID=UPI00211894ED|nr:2'-5' RNA ligase family protein [Mesorhizobium sp. LMG17149]